MAGLLMRIAVALSTLAFAGFSFAQNISIGTGGTGGVYYPMGGGLAAVLSKHVPGMQATVDIKTGRKTVLQYLLKPILRAKQTALRER